MDVRTLIRDERGTQFLENGMWIALVVLGLTGAGLSLAKTIDGKYGEMEQKIQILNVPQP
ncbi:MAG: hypothetical protein HSCHL_1297 [Hydrogenibacillus schlegelii]|uniref:Flp pilus assembly protein, pilin Flp n=1 Tax=Hydrogenibacillus schlegelii TaxID=1484 RepID=A0A2T5G5Y1_HYDSH|nr:hypothetical protein [Hydrogenibacillus schlegelii]PTQ51594.1 MAG: hypothetical protein HSCHL_1297 [Hydrogenibacillus schlegelii]